MAKISNQEAYPEDKQVALEDYLIGTDSQDRKRTKTYPLSSVVEVIQGAIEENLEMPKNTSDLVNDGNGTEAGPFATIEDARGKTYQFSNLKEVIVVHGKAVIVDVVVVVGVQQVFTSVEHSPDLNNVTVRFSKQETDLVKQKER